VSLSFQQSSLTLQQPSAIGFQPSAKRLILKQPSLTLQARKSAMLLKVHFETSDEGGYTPHVPALPGCISERNTLEEARRNIREAIELYLEPAEPIPAAPGTLVEEIAM
jgi:predicted RNase H-like HicB family nuclease